MVFRTNPFNKKIELTSVNITFVILRFVFNLVLKYNYRKFSLVTTFKHLEGGTFGQSMCVESMFNPPYFVPCFSSIWVFLSYLLYHKEVNLINTLINNETVIRQILLSNNTSFVSSQEKHFRRVLLNCFHPRFIVKIPNNFLASNSIKHYRILACSQQYQYKTCKMWFSQC